MKVLPYLLFFSSSIAAIASSISSIAGLQFEYTSSDSFTSVPYQEFYGSKGSTDSGFSNSIIERFPYSYSNGVISFPEWSEEIRLTFTDANSGTYEIFEVFGIDAYLDDFGTFRLVTPSLEEKTDWQRTETFDSPLSNDYWQVWRRSVDSLAYDDGELSFIFGSSSEDSYADTEVVYARTLPMNEDWQVVLDDIYAASGLSNFEIGVELEIASPEFECGVSFQDYGNGREFAVFIEQQVASGDWEYASAYVSANEDVRISSGGNIRIVHIASSRELIFEYQPDEASAWSELARLNLESGSFVGENGTGNLTGGLISSADNRMSVDIEARAESDVPTQIAELEIAGIEIGSYMLPPQPPASLAGKSYVLTPSSGGSKTVPDQVTFTADTISFGFSGNLLESDSYSYSDGTVTYDGEEVIEFTYTSSTGGTYEEGWEDDFGFYVENTGTFKESNISLRLQTKWERSETMNNALSTKYWQVCATIGDSVKYNDGELNFIFDEANSPMDEPMGYYEDQEIEISYAGALPLDKDWEILIDDTYVSDSVDQFAMGYYLELEGSFDCEFGFGDQGFGREVYFYVDGDIASFSASQSSTNDPRIQNGLNFRIQHLASSRELVYSYQPDGVSDWTELARVNLSTGAISGLDGNAPLIGQLTGQLPSNSENLFFGVDIDKFSIEATPIENIEIGSINVAEIKKSTLKVQVSLAKGIIADSDGDATVSIDDEPYAVSLVRGKGTLEVALPTGSTYTVGASLGALTSGTAKPVLMNKATSLSLILDGDSDEDGLSDSQEARYKGDPNNADTDGDGISDGDEVYTYRTRVDDADTDKDGLSDYDEINTYSTNVLKADSDGDRMSDSAELEAGTDPNDKSEYPAYLKVQVSLAKGIIADSDADATVSIDDEPYAVSLVRGKGTLQVALPTGSTYTVGASLGALTSGTAKPVLMNKATSLSLILDGDSDEDGLSDSQEARYKGDPNNADTDNDGISDGDEVYTYRTRVDDADTDKDGLSDYDEINTYSTNVLKADSDGDKMSDSAELQAGTDPNDKSEYPAYLTVQVSLAKGIIADSDGDATVSIDDEPYAVSLVRGKGTLEVALPTGSTYTVSASLDDLTSGDARPVLLSKAATVSLVLDGDSDEDGLSDSQEARYKGDPNNADTDGDGISDGDEVYTYRTRVDVADTDKDGFTDKQELDLNTNPLSSKDKPEAYIERPVFVDLNLTYESADGYIVEKWDTAQMAYFLSSAAGDLQQGASIYLKYSLDGSNLKWIVRADSRDIDVSSLMRPIKVSKPAQLDGEVLSSMNLLSQSYSVAQMFSLAISAGKTKSLSLVVSGASSFYAVDSNTSELEIDLAASSDYKALGMLKDSSMSDGPILIEGTLTMGDELANVLGQTIGPIPSVN